MLQDMYVEGLSKLSIGFSGSCSQLSVARTDNATIECADLMLDNTNSEAIITVGKGNINEDKRSTAWRSSILLRQKDYKRPDAHKLRSKTYTAYINARLTVQCEGFFPVYHHPAPPYFSTLVTPLSSESDILEPAFSS